MALDNRSIEGRFDRKREEKERIKAGLPGEDEPPLPPPVEPIHTDKNKQVGRNDPCPCGSGKKFKKCCGKQA
jgi:preprotein translocase subunit SecA